MISRITIGVLGPGESAGPEDNELAYNLGAAIAEEGWTLVTGGREFGVMNAVMKGASDNDGITIGILPGDDTRGSSHHATIRIVTGLGNARNNITVLSSHVIVVCGMAAGTASEVSLAIKANKKVVLLKQSPETVIFFKKIGDYRVIAVDEIEEVILQIKDFISMNQIAN